MYKIFDYSCITPDCSEEGKEVEIMLDSSSLSFPLCKVCSGEMKRHIPAPRGYVKGTETRCSQK